MQPHGSTVQQPVVWKKLNDAISDVIDNITLADLVDWQIAKDGDYSI